MLELSIDNATSTAESIIRLSTNNQNTEKPDILKRFKVLEKFELS